MVNEGNQQLATQRGQKVCLKQILFQCTIGFQLTAQKRHRGADSLTGGGKIIDHHRALWLLRREHGVIDVLVLMPHAKFGTQAVVLRFRGVDGKFG